MSKHTPTPGPWFTGGQTVFASNVNGMKTFKIASVTRATDARLIAAAPLLRSELADLLNVLDALSAAMPILNTSAALTAARESGRRAIAKAEGSDAHG